MEKKDCSVGKKRHLIEKEIDEFSKVLRSGKCLGKDRFKRSYWTLNRCSSILVESDYVNSLSNMKADFEIVNDLMQDIIEKIEVEDEERQVIKRFSNLVEEIQEPFGLRLKIEDPDVLNLNFNQIELLIKHKLQFKEARKIDEIYLSSDLDSSTKWRLCNSSSDLVNSLSKRGIREKQLFKNLTKISEETLSNDQTELCFNDFFTNNQQSLTTAQLIYKEKLKLLKQVNSLENRVYSANLQIQNQNDNKLELYSNDPLFNAKTRLLNLELKIERRYLKYPFCGNKKIINIKLKTPSIQT